MKVAEVSGSAASAANKCLHFCGLQWGGGPKIDMLYGRMDVSHEDECAIDGILPGASPSCTAGHDHDARMLD